MGGERVVRVGVGGGSMGGELGDCRIDQSY